MLVAFLLAPAGRRRSLRCLVYDETHAGHDCLLSFQGVWGLNSLGGATLGP